MKSLEAGLFVVLWRNTGQYGHDPERRGLLEMPAYFSPKERCKKRPDAVFRTAARRASGEGPLPPGLWGAGLGPTAFQLRGAGVASHSQAQDGQ